MGNLNSSNTSNNVNTMENNNITENIRELPLITQLVGRTSLSPDQSRLLRHSLLNLSNRRGVPKNSQIQYIRETMNEFQTDERSDASDDGPI